MKDDADMTDRARDSDTVHGLVGRRVSFIFAWYDFWVGLYFDRSKEALYVFIVPMIGLRIDLRPRAAWLCRNCGQTFRFRSCFMLHRVTCSSNAEAHGRAVARTVQPLVGLSDSEGGRE